MRRKKDNGIIDLFDGFDTILVLPMWFLFSLLVSMPATCFLLVIVMRDVIARRGELVLVGIFFLTLAGMATLVIISGAFAKSARAVIETIIAFLSRDKEGTTINVEGGTKTVEGSGRFDASGQRPQVSGRSIRRQRIGSGSSTPGGMISRREA